MAAADGGYGATSAIERMETRIKALKNLSPLTKVVAEKFQAATDAAFAGERSVTGDQWPALAASTVERRIAKMKGANRRTRKTIAQKVGLERGTLTKSAQATRHQARLVYGHGGGNVKMLFDTRRMQRTTKYVGKPTTIVLETVAYMNPHVSGAGNGRPPKRNPLVYERINGEMVLTPALSALFRAMLIRYFDTNEVK